MDPSVVSQFGGVQGYLIIAAIFFGPALGVWSSQLAKKLLGPKTEEVAAEAVKQGQQEATTGFLSLTKQLSKALSDERTAHEQTRTEAARDRSDAERIESGLRREVSDLRRQLDNRAR